MQSVVVLPLVMPPQPDAAMEPLPPSDGAFHLAFEAEDETAPLPRGGGDPSPMAVLPGLAFPAALTFPVVPEDAEAGLMTGPGVGLSVDRWPVMIGSAEPGALPELGTSLLSGPAPSDRAAPIDVAPPGMPLAMQMIDAARAEAPEGLRGGLPSDAVGGGFAAQPDAPGRTPAQPVSSLPDLPLPDPVGREAKAILSGPDPQARAVEAGEATVPATNVSQLTQEVPHKAPHNPPLTGPTAVQRPEAVSPQPSAASDIQGQAPSAPDQPVSAPGRYLPPANLRAVASEAAVVAVVAERSDGMALVQTADLPAGSVAAVEPLVLPAEATVEARAISPSPGRAVAAATGSPVVPTPPEPGQALDPAPSSDATDAIRPSVGDRAMAAPVPVQPLPAPLPGFWERLFSGLVATDSDPVAGRAEAEEDQVASDAPTDATAGPRDTKSTAPTLASPAEPAAVVLFARDQSKVWRQDADVTPDGVPAAAVPFASTPGPMGAAAAMPVAPHAAPTALPVPQVAGQIAAALSQTSDGATELALSPEELGHVRLKLERDAKHPERMIVHITFERPETMDLFRRHAGDLAEALRDAGFAGADIGFGPQGGGEQGFSRGEESRTLPGAFAGSPDEPQRPEPSAPRLMAGASLDLRL